ncbi:hypothetical protein Nepgr_018301 [Nepenthes gracilis]|uniref:F-box domain-containing protein n=1 Tax=Nepenthes gracilis TaxID=150966 RepID=A0AAD3SR21_NEPGR|nr:hypothetical protein Nepgr_018301 [Nepenthes gracilis]
MPITFISPANPSEMDPGIWSHLPEELLDHILCFLPLKVIFNLRSTCKRFKTLVFEPSFISKYYSTSPSSASPLSSFLLLSHPQFHTHFLLYESILGSWRKLSLSLNPFVPSSSLLSTSNGLLCFSLPSSSSFLVCNILSKSSRVVEFPKLPFSFEFITLISSNNGFKLFIIASGSSSNCAYIYKSKSESWRQFDGFGQILSDNYHQPAVCRNDCLYFTTSDPASVVCFDLESGHWRAPIAELPSELTFMRLVSDGKGRLFLIGGVGRNGISRYLKLWELGNGGENWLEVETMPDMMYRKFVSVCYHNYEHVYCFWHQGLLCIGCYTWLEILYYRVARRTWHWLPKCPSLPENWRCGFRWFSFAPELCASV